MKIILKIINDSETSKKKKKISLAIFILLWYQPFLTTFHPIVFFSAESKGEILYSNIRWLTLCTFTGSRF